MTIETTLQSIETKLDLMLNQMKDRPANITHELENRFVSALATLNVIQLNFTGQSDPLNDEIMYYSIESARNEIKAAYKLAIGQELKMVV